MNMGRRPREVLSTLVTYPTAFTKTKCAVSSPSSVKLPDCVYHEAQRYVPPGAPHTRLVALRPVNLTDVSPKSDWSLERLRVYRIRFQKRCRDRRGRHEQLPALRSIAGLQNRSARGCASKYLARSK